MIAGVRGPPARMSSPFTAPFNLKVAPCRGMRTGGPRTRPMHPGPRSQKPRSAAQNSCHWGFAKSAFFQGDRIFKSWSPWVRGPPARMSSPFTAPFNLKVAPCRGMRTGGPRTQPMHPGPRTQKPRSAAQNSCHRGFREDHYRPSVRRDRKYGDVAWRLV